jgi:hypothetical protein
MRNFLIPIAALLALGGVAYAAQGQAPQQGYELMQGKYILGIAGGVNYSFASGISAAGTTQATSTPLPTVTRLIEVDTVASGSGVSLPPAIAGTEISIYNGGANTLTMYPSIKNNPVTGVQDTIDTTLTSDTIASHFHGFLFCAKTGNWSF